MGATKTYYWYMWTMGREVLATPVTHQEYENHHDAEMQPDDLYLRVTFSIVTSDDVDCVAARD